MGGVPRIVEAPEDDEANIAATLLPFMRWAMDSSIFFMNSGCCWSKTARATPHPSIPRGPIVFLSHGTTATGEITRMHTRAKGGAP